MTKAYRLLWTASQLLVILCFALAFYAAGEFPDGFPMHYNLAGEYSSVAPVWVVYLYPLAICILRIAGRIAEKLIVRFVEVKPHRQYYISAAVLALSAFITCSMGVGATSGNHIFMFSEIVIILAYIAYVVYCEIRK